MGHQPAPVPNGSQSGIPFHLWQTICRCPALGGGKPMHPGRHLTNFSQMQGFHLLINALPAQPLEKNTQPLFIGTWHGFPNNQLPGTGRYGFWGSHVGAPAQGLHPFCRRFNLCFGKWQIVDAKGKDMTAHNRFFWIHPQNEILRIGVKPNFRITKTVMQQDSAAESGEALPLFFPGKGVKRNYGTNSFEVLGFPHLSSIRKLFHCFQTDPICCIFKSISNFVAEVSPGYFACRQGCNEQRHLLRWSGR